MNIEYPPASPERLAMAGRSNKEPQNFEGDPSTFDIQDSIFDSAELVAGCG
jgi:hypothetical protein